MSFYKLNETQVDRKIKIEKDRLEQEAATEREKAVKAAAAADAAVVAAATAVSEVEKTEGSTSEVTG